eukprot:comp26320_c0_seq1/m.47098 comp26320_c0_seq1/g.47098  ORF comp26320_c0_seq1/g.47098 comp26320_c0_seq1/m.47098 type:complete len:156 (-) comp26320_c0_seq1:443-910(-)
MAARVADLVARLNNGYVARLNQIRVQNTRLNRDILNILWKEGYINEYRLALPEKVAARIDPQTVAQAHAASAAKLPIIHSEIEVLLKYKNNQKAIQEMKVVSKPSKKKFVKFHDLCMQRMHGGLGIYIIKTTSGIMTDRQALLTRNGGELLMEVA